MTESDDRVTSVLVLGLFIIFVASVVLSVFVLDWSDFPHSIDLWAKTSCGGLLCQSRPLEAAGVGDFRWYAIATLWLTALAGTLVSIQIGRYLLGRPAWKPLLAIGHLVCVLDIVSVLLTAAQPVLRSTGEAPVILIVGCASAMLAMRVATSMRHRPIIDRATRIPIARVVR